MLFKKIHALTGLLLWAATLSLNAGEPPTSPEDVRPLQVGVPVPQVSLLDVQGDSVPLHDRVAEQPSVLIFYRGGWCPYCTEHLSELADVEDELTRRGFQLLAISPDRPAKLDIDVEGVEIGYELFSDASMDAAKAFGLAFRVDPATLERYDEYGIDLAEASGHDHHLLPVPAVYLIDTEGVIQYVYANPDHTTRLEPEAILEAADAMEAGLDDIAEGTGAMASAFRALLVWIDALGVIGPLVLILAYIVACVFFIPGSALTLGAGALFGVIRGSILVSIASTLGATVAFIVGRYLARDWVARKIEGNKKFSAIDDAVGREGWKIVGLTRLSPIFPFNLLNYAYGLTNVRLRDYVLASWIGMMPGTVMYVYIGSLARLGVEAAETSAAQTALRIVGLIATIAVTVYITRIAKRALKERVEE